MKNTECSSLLRKIIFCGDDLANIEANGWVATQAIMHDNEEEFAVGDLVPASIIHCEEHADHDH